MNSPKFALKSVLCRYIRPEERLSGSRPAAAAFLPDPPNPKVSKPFFSVNSMEIEGPTEIANYHRSLRQSGKGKVAICDHTVYEYNEAGKKADVPLSYNGTSQNWEFQGSKGKEAAYGHHPSVESKHEFKSPSHSGVEFVRALTVNNEGKFARRLASKKYHLR